MGVLVIQPYSGKLRLVQRAAGTRESEGGGGSHSANPPLDPPLPGREKESSSGRSLGLSKRRQNTREKDASSISYRHDVSFALVHEFDRHAHAFAVETDVVVVAHDDFKKERKKERKISRGGDSDD